MKFNAVKRFAALVAVIIAACVSFSGCTVNEFGFPIPLSPAEKSAFEMCTKMYPDSQLDEIYSYMSEEKNIDSLNKKYEIQCLRKDGDNYRVLYVSDVRVLIFTFDHNRNWINTEKKECLRNLVKSVMVFDDLKEGDSVHVVQAEDQRSYIPFMARDDDSPLVSDHYTEDGYHLRVEYDAQHNIVSLETTPV